MSRHVGYAIEIFSHCPVLGLAYLQVEAHIDMARGAYDTTGVKKPGAPPPPPK